VRRPVCRSTIRMVGRTEQYFRTVQSLSVHDRDPVARRTMMFDALDTFQGLAGTQFDILCTLRHARRVLEELQGALSTDVSAVLLPRAQRAVAALRELQDGFFLPSRVSGGNIRLPDRNSVRPGSAVGGGDGVMATGLAERGPRFRQSLLKGRRRATMRCWYRTMGRYRRTYRILPTCTCSSCLHDLNCCGGRSKRCPPRPASRLRTSELRPPTALGTPIEGRVYQVEIRRATHGENIATPICSHPVGTVPHLDLPNAAMACAGRGTFTQRERPAGPGCYSPAWRVLMFAGLVLERACASHSWECRGPRTPTHLRSSRRRVRRGSGCRWQCRGW